MELLATTGHELILFAAVGFVIGGIDDLFIDMIWIFRAFWRRFVVYRYCPKANAATLAVPAVSGRLAIFVPAWDESAVISAMLAYALKTFGDANYRIYVGCYHNDPQTIAAVEAIGRREISIVLCSNPGPTTKADCLNALWHALVADEIAERSDFKGVVLHDAEDVVHSGELTVFDTLIERFAFVQLPVLPLPDPGSRWIAGHYADEFAEAHGKTLVVREAIGAAIPAAGVGCAFSRAVLGRIAEERGGEPFDGTSLTEDYEIGLRIAELGGQGIFVRLPGSRNSGVVGIRAHFPRTLETAVRQKSRWIAGIALSGWDRLGWSGGFAETWMRLHDRRAPIGAIILTSAYVGSLIQPYGWLERQSVFHLPPRRMSCRFCFRCVARSCFGGF